MLSALGKTVLISNFRRFHRLAAYLSRYTKRPIGLALGASKLAEIFDESFYNESEGGLLGGLGQLFKNPARLYVYPHLDLDSGHKLTVENFPVPPHLRHLYAHLRGEPLHPGHPQLQRRLAAHPFAGRAGEDSIRRCLVGTTGAAGHRGDHQARRAVWVSREPGARRVQPLARVFHKAQRHVSSGSAWLQAISLAGPKGPELPGGGWPGCYLPAAAEFPGC